MGKYAYIENGLVVSTQRRPDWRNDDGSIVSDELLASNGYVPVVDTVPLHDYETQYIERLPEDQWRVFNDRVEVSYSVYDKTLSEIVALRVKEISNYYQSLLNGGFLYDFGTTKHATFSNGLTELAGKRVLQTRVRDRERWLVTSQVANQYVNAGTPDAQMRDFRTEDNARIPMTAQDAVNCLNAMQSFFGLALDAMWYHKDAINVLAQQTDVTSEDILGYDYTTGWPG